MTSSVRAACRVGCGPGRALLGLWAIFALTTALGAQEPFEIPLRINMGGDETVDSQGNLWLGDRPCGLEENADPLGIRPNLSGGTRAICDWCVPDALAFEELDLDPFDAGDSHIFSTIRWDVGSDAEDFYVELPVEDGVYDIILYFNECCCTGRHFKIEVEGEIEYADVSYLVYNELPALTQVGKLDVRNAEVTDGSLTIGFLPCSECPGVNDTNAIINAIEVLEGGGDPCEEPALPRLCASGFECTIDENGEVTGTWSAPLCDEADGFQILKNGDVLEELPGDATEFTDTLAERGAEYQLVTLLPGGNEFCPSPVCTVRRADLVFDIPLRINMGGEETVDSQGNLWLGDRPCGLAENADPLGIRPNPAAGTRAICDWCVPDALAFEELDLDPFDPGDSHIFSTIRWDEGGDAEDFYVELPVENGVYDINLYFNECCCTGRHFKIEVEGEIEYEDVSYLDYNPEPALTKVGLLDVRNAEVTDGSLTIGFLPCPECPGVSDTNAIINAIEVLPGGGDPCDDATLTRLCASGFECEIGENGAVSGSWTAPQCGTPTGYQILKNGDVLLELPAEAAEFTDTLEDRSAEYQLVTVLPGGDGPCPPRSCTVSRSDILFDIPLRINMGGDETVDSEGNVWLGDRPCGLPPNSDPLGIRPNLNGGFNAICNWCVPEPISMEELDLDPLDPGDAHIFSTIRWDVGGDADDFYLEIPIPNGEYDINFYFNECCCEGRHFKIEVQDEIEYEDVSFLEYSDEPLLTKVGMLDVTNVVVDNELLRIGFLPCPECPGVSDTNAIINAIEILGEPAVARPEFNRGDPNDDGTTNIADSVFILGNLFSGGPDPTCRESADVNDDGAINITDPIALLTFLFGGGEGAPTPPAAPGTPDTPCGPDPDGSQQLGCDAYTSCE